MALVLFDHNVFCADFEHMQQMISLSRDWFSRVDSEPHIYTAYSEDPGTDRAFAVFKEDASDHLKLLYCIDMLNEGVHGDLNVPTTYVYAESFVLGKWIQRHNEKRANGTSVIKLTPDRHNCLSEIGMI